MAPPSKTAAWASFQRAKVQDLYDLRCFAVTPFHGELLRRLAVLKLWQVRDPFDPELFFARLRGGHHEWEDLRRLLRSSERLEPDDVLGSIDTRFAVLRSLTELERKVIADAKSGRNRPLADRLRAEILALFEAAA
jgi:hypothetical protein